MDELINCLSAVSFRVLALLAGCIGFLFIMYYFIERYSKDGNFNPMNPNRPVEYLSKKELISLLKKERDEAKAIHHFIHSVHIQDFSNPQKAFESERLKLWLKDRHLNDWLHFKYPP